MKTQKNLMKEKVNDFMLDNNFTLKNDYESYHSIIVIQCNKCNHTWNDTLYHLKVLKKENRCPNCGKGKLTVEDIKNTFIQYGWQYDEFSQLQISYKVICKFCQVPTLINHRKIKNKNCLICKNCINNKLENPSKGIIYKIIFPNNKYYIGQTIRKITTRKSLHYKSSINPQKRHHNSKLCRAIRKYGFDNLIWEILHSDVEPSRLDELEIYEISKHNTYYDGYNSTLGGHQNTANRLDSIRKSIKENELQLNVQKNKETLKEKQHSKQLKKEAQQLAKVLKKKDREEEKKQLKQRMKLTEHDRRVESAQKKYKLRLPKSSQYRGVCWNKQKNKWMASIRHGGRTKIRLGNFVNEIDAAKAYDAAAKMYHGPKAKLNFP